MMQRELILIVALAVTLLLIAALVAMFIVRRTREANPMGNQNEMPLGRLDQQFYKCPKCQTYMLSGFCYAARGLFWRGIEDKAPGMFSPVGKFVVNTLNHGFKPRGNPAWRCEHCNLLLIDHSILVSQSAGRAAG